MLMLGHLLLGVVLNSYGRMLNESSCGDAWKIIRPQAINTGGTYKSDTFQFNYPFTFCGVKYMKYGVIGTKIVFKGIYLMRNGGGQI